MTLLCEKESEILILLKIDSNTEQKSVIQSAYEKKSFGNLDTRSMLDMVCDEVEQQNLVESLNSAFFCSGVKSHPIVVIGRLHPVRLRYNLG